MREANEMHYYYNKIVLGDTEYVTSIHTKQIEYNIIIIVLEDSSSISIIIQKVYD